MKNFEEFKGYSTRLEFDPVTKTFVTRRLEPVMSPQVPETPPAEPVETVPDDLRNPAQAEDTRVVKLPKKKTPQTDPSPKAMRSRTRMSFKKILPR